LWQGEYGKKEEIRMLPVNTFLYAFVLIAFLAAFLTGIVLIIKELVKSH